MKIVDSVVIKFTSYFTLLSFSVSLGWLIRTVIIESPLRGIGERWDVSWGGGLMVYCTLGVHFTEKKLEPGGAHLGEKTKQKKKHMTKSSFTNHILKGKVPAVGGGGEQQVDVQFPPGLTV